MEPEQELLSTKKAAEFMGISTRRLDGLRRKKELPAQRGPWGSWLYRSQDLMAYVERLAGVEPRAAVAVDAVKIDSESDGESTNDMAEMTEIINAMMPSSPGTPSVVDEAPLVRMLNAILVNGIDSGASDIHIEPTQKYCRVRCRIDGVLKIIMTIPKHIQMPIANRIKIMADIDQYKRSVPHRGHIPVKHGDVNYNLRVSVMPTLYGESIVIHILKSEPKAIGQLGMVNEQSSILERWAEYRSGLILIAGSSGSGVTTTAFALLRSMNGITRKIMTLEVQPEFAIEGIEQTYLRENNSLTFAIALEAMLGHNPDILFLSDLRDKEAAKAAVDAAQSGVLVIATIAAKDSVDALRRLVTLGVSREAVADAVIGVVAQRLLRKLCVHCREEYVISEGELETLGADFGHIGERAICRSAGCEECKMTGIRGRMGIFEIWESNPELGKMLRDGNSFAEIREWRKTRKISTLRDDLLTKLFAGVFGLETAVEAIR